MNINLKHVIGYGSLCVIIFILIIVICGMAKCSRPKVTQEIKHITDTIVNTKHDTIVKEKTVLLPGQNHFVYVPKKTTDTIEAFVYVHDTVTIDSIQCVYVGHDTLIVDTVYINNYIEKTVKEKKLITFGCSAGIGATYGLVHKKFDFGPVVAVGVHYNF